MQWIMLTIAFGQVDAPDGLKALTHPEVKVRYQAAQTLVNLGPLAKFAVPELKNGLKDKNGFVRVKVAEALWAIEQSTLGMKVLIEALGDEDPMLRSHATRVVARLGKKADPAIPALIENLKHADVDLRLDTVIALGDLGPVAAEAATPVLVLANAKEIDQLEFFVADTLARLGPRAIGVLSAAIEGADASRRRVAAIALSNAGKDAAPAKSALVKVLFDNDASIRANAVRTLGKIGESAKDAAPGLEKLCKDAESNVRLTAALAYWQVTDSDKQLGVIKAALGDVSELTRASACRTLAEMGPAGAPLVADLIPLLKDETTASAALETLAAIGPKAIQASDAMTLVLKGPDASRKALAAFALWKVREDPKESLAVLVRILTMAETPDQCLAAEYLERMGSAARPAIPDLQAAARSDDSPLREAATRALKAIQ